MRIPYILALACLMPLGAQAEAPATTTWRTDVSSSIARYERAWAAKQLAYTSSKYDIGDEVLASPIPATVEELFSAYKFEPVYNAARTVAITLEPTSSDGTTARLCLSAILQSPAELEGFMQGLAVAKAGLATAACAPAALSSGFTYPVTLHAVKSVHAKRAAEFIVRDKADRVEQVKAKNVIAFALPEGKLHKLTAAVGKTSEVRTAILQNTSSAPWGIPGVAIAAPFGATLYGCAHLPPMGTCSVGVVFSPTQTGRFMEYLSITPAPGVTLSLKVGGTAVAATGVGGTVGGEVGKVKPGKKPPKK